MAPWHFSSWTSELQAESQPLSLLTMKRNHRKVGRSVHHRPERQKPERQKWALTPGIRCLMVTPFFSDSTNISSVNVSLKVESERATNVLCPNSTSYNQESSVLALGPGDCTQVPFLSSYTWFLLPATPLPLSSQLIGPLLCSAWTACIWEAPPTAWWAGCLSVGAPASPDGPRTWNAHPAEPPGLLCCRPPTAWSKGCAVFLTLSFPALAWQEIAGCKLNKWPIPSDLGPKRE